MEIQIEKLYKQAVDAALANDWEKAIAISTSILDIDPNYIDAFLGLGFAYMQTGDLKNAKKYYNKALRNDPANIIARNNVDKIEILQKKGKLPSQRDKKDIALDPDTFMNIEGKTKIVTLPNTGQADILVKLKVGEKLELSIKKRKIEIRNKDNEYVGALPDDLSKRLIFFLEAKSKYTTFVKAATKNSVDVFIREDKKGSKVKNFISFPDNIQDDMKIIIGKNQENEEEAIVKDLTQAPDEDTVETVDDIEELAKAAEETTEDIIGINHDDDDDDSDE